MKINPLPSQEYLHQCFEYLEDGKLVRKLLSELILQQTTPTILRNVMLEKKLEQIWAKVIAKYELFIREKTKFS